MYYIIQRQMQTLNYIQLDGSFGVTGIHCFSRQLQVLAHKSDIDTMQSIFQAKV